MTLQLDNLDFVSASRILNLPAPASDNEPARLVDLTTYVHGLHWKDDARVASQVDITLSAPGATIDGITMALNDRVLVYNQSAAAQNGIYVWNGAAVAMTRSPDADTYNELEAAVISVTEGTNAGGTFKQTGINGTIDVTAVTFTNFLTGSPVASETVQGIARVATQTDTNTGTVDDEFITPLKLTNWSKRTLMTTQLIGDGVATQYTVTHNFNTRNVIIRVYRNSGTYDTVNCGDATPTVNTVQLNFTTVPTTNQFVVCIIAQVAS